MDVYVGLGLLAAGVVIVGFLMLDNWLKKRNVQINQLSGIQNSSRNEFSGTKFRGGIHG